MTASTLPLVVPRCLEAEASLRTFRLVLEDIVTTGATAFRLGDELAIGAIEEALSALARLHGTFWDDLKLTGNAWVWVTFLWT